MPAVFQKSFRCAAAPPSPLVHSVLLLLSTQELLLGVFLIREDQAHMLHAS